MVGTTRVVDSDSTNLDSSSESELEQEIMSPTKKRKLDNSSNKQASGAKKLITSILSNGNSNVADDNSSDSDASSVWVSKQRSPEKHKNAKTGQEKVTEIGSSSSDDDSEPVNKRKIPDKNNKSSPSRQIKHMPSSSSGSESDSTDLDSGSDRDENKKVADVGKTLDRDTHSISDSEGSSDSDGEEADKTVKNMKEIESMNSKGSAQSSPTKKRKTVEFTKPVDIDSSSSESGS